MRPVCLTIGGSDSCGGAGIQADLRVFEALGVKGCSTMTALTAQNPHEIRRIESVPLVQLDAELHAIFDHYEVAAIKTGMLLDAEHIAVISAVLNLFHAGKPLIIDPVMISSSGAELLDASGQQALLETLVPMATLLTPNIPEAEVLLGRAITDPARDAAELAGRLQTAVLLTGGHVRKEKLVDVFCDVHGEAQLFIHSRQPWGAEESHGTGCRLAAAICAGTARGKSLPEAVSHAIDWLTAGQGGG
ncbi:MAG: bifunctional hydroxymethylpyrimidine kinase/phosphomethylpyrimidine kinase [Mariprofundaceae bacterium]|nr:bifunctional hydroxymethylpyrimidine kinase/phosphomethylpyrimidine kinase [Mariprofundaceae bacterium]